MGAPAPLAPPIPLSPLAPVPPDVARGGSDGKKRHFIGPAPRDEIAGDCLSDDIRHSSRRYRSVPGLAELGDGRISYSERSMPLLSALASRLRVDRPFAGMTIAACLHVTAETAVFVGVLCAGGARVRLAASNPLSTQDDIVAALTARDGVEVFARAGVDRDTYYEHIALALGADAEDGPRPRHRRRW